MKLSRMSVGLAVRAMRDAARLTINDLATMTGISISSLSRTENGLRDLNFAEATAIAAAVKIDIEHLRTLAETFEREGVTDKQRQVSELERDLNELQRLAIETAITARLP